MKDRYDVDESNITYFMLLTFMIQKLWEILRIGWRDAYKEQMDIPRRKDEILLGKLPINYNFH